MISNIEIENYFNSLKNSPEKTGKPKFCLNTFTSFNKSGNTLEEKQFSLVEKRLYDYFKTGECNPKFIVLNTPFRISKKDLFPNREDGGSDGSEEVTVKIKHILSVICEHKDCNEEATYLCKISGIKRSYCNAHYDGYMVLNKLKQTINTKNTYMKNLTDLTKNTFEQISRNISTEKKFSNIVGSYTRLKKGTVVMANWPVTVNTSRTQPFTKKLLIGKNKNSLEYGIRVSSITHLKKTKITLNIMSSFIIITKYNKFLDYLYLL